MEIDPKFKQASARAKKRRTQRTLQRLVIFGGGAVGCIVVGLLVFWLISRDGGDSAEALAGAPEDGQAVQVDTGEVAAPPVRAATPFVDIAGDPMILRFENGSGAVDATTLAGPNTLDARRFGDPRPDRLTLISEPLIVQERQLITALPSSREDFVFFQAQRSASLNAPTNLPAFSVEQGSEAVVEVAADGEDSFGEALGDDSDAPATYIETRIQNTTSVSFVKPEAQRRPLYEDIVVRLVIARSLQDVLATNGFEDAADSMAERIAPLIPESVELPPDSIVAIRARRSGETLQALQMSIYGPDRSFGSVAVRGSLGFVLAGDPWVDSDLRRLAAPTQSFVAPQQDFRLLDAVYSAAIRKGVPTTLVGEMIVMLSQSYDLDAFAAPGDEITILYAPDPGETKGPGQLMFAGITGPSGNMPCYVSADSDGKFSCFNDQGRVGSGGGGGFTTPVQGTLTSKFGPRHHPILKTVRLHAGVDWAAPTGTPIVAALDGRIAVAGDGGGYGNVIYIDHAGGLQSRYAHMNRFADGMRAGRQVRQGEVIGYVGTTGRSTGPHLHFEFRQNGNPVDPFTLNVQSAGTTVVASAGGASQAVEALVNQIIKVESAGNANAKNPLSTATGLGQFIESTWLRMMRDYRPDLAGTMSRADLLALRTDPTLSREMVTNLARENERFLSSRGHSITPGRLYLAHFLGPGGANKALSSADGQTVLEVMGAAVVNANPFLRNYTIADLKAWADRKMRGAGSGGGGGVVAAAPRPVMTAEMRAYKEIVDQMLAETG